MDEPHGNSAGPLKPIYFSLPLPVKRVVRSKGLPKKFLAVPHQFCLLTCGHLHFHQEGVVPDAVTCYECALARVPAYRESQEGIALRTLLWPDTITFHQWEPETELPFGDMAEAEAAGLRFDKNLANVVERTDRTMTSVMADRKFFAGVVLGLLEKARFG